MSLEQIVANLVEKFEHRFYGKYRGFVANNDDPERMGRLRLRVPSVLGENVVTGWALPCLPYGGAENQGFLFIPEKGAGVWVEFEEGDLEFPIWTGTFWSRPGGESELPRPNQPDGTQEDAVQRPSTRKIIKTRKGHTIQFEDADGSEMITIVEGKHGHVITLDMQGIAITDVTGNQIIMSDHGITCTDKNHNSIVMNATSGFPAGHGIDLNGGERVCLEGLIQWLLKHKHIGNMGAPAPLSPDDIADLSKAFLPESHILSDTVKAK